MSADFWFARAIGASFWALMGACLALGGWLAQDRACAVAGWVLCGVMVALFVVAATVVWWKERGGGE